MRHVILALGCLLCACDVTASLGDHARLTSDAASTTPDASDEALASSDGTNTREASNDDASVLTPDLIPPAEDAAQIDPVPREEPNASTFDAGSDAGDGDEPPPEIADAGGEHPALTDAEMPEDSGTVEHLPGCDLATDNACRICDQSLCCDARRACLELEACACTLECYYADNPAGCRESCPDPGERYSAWLGCLEESCAEPCVL